MDLANMERYQKETGGYAIWHGVKTEGYKKWANGGKIYKREAERISLFVSKGKKSQWKEFIKRHSELDLSKLIRKAVNTYLRMKTHDVNLSNNNPYHKEIQFLKQQTQNLIEHCFKISNDNILALIQNIYKHTILLGNEVSRL